MAQSRTENLWMERFARMGYAARGVVYAVVGVLAVQTALGTRGARRAAATTDTRGALQEVAAHSIPLLWLLAVGLFAYAVWRAAQGLLDRERKGSGLKGLAHRLGRLFTAVVYGSLGLAAVRLALGAHRRASADAHATQEWTARLMGEPFGRWLVAAVGVGVIAGGFYQLWRGWTEKFKQEIRLQEMDSGESRLAIHAGKLGLMARGVVFLISGWFLVQAAVKTDPRQVRGLSGALAVLAAQPHGAILLGLVAVGLVAFGAWSLLLARYGRIVA
jgi:hypothetical protein